MVSGSVLRSSISFEYFFKEVFNMVRITVYSNRPAGLR